MKIPSIFYGKAGEVRKNLGKTVRDLIVSRDFGHFDPGPFLDTREVTGEILVTREHWPSVTPQFHCYLLPIMLQDRVDPGEHRSLTHDWLMASLDEQWRFICTLNGDAHYGFGPDPKVGARRYAEAAIRHWPSMEPEQYRFGPKVDVSDGVLDMWITLFAAIDTLGLPPMERDQARRKGPAVLLELADCAAQKKT
jgi:hypothetical protein